MKDNEDATDRILLHGDGSWATTGLKTLSGLLQDRFPTCRVASADEHWLTEALHGSTAEKAWQSYHPLEPGLEYRLPDWTAHIEYVYVILGWVGGTASKVLVERSTEAAVDVVVKWARERRQQGYRPPTTGGFILGPKGEILQQFEVEPSQPKRRKKWIFRRY